MIDYKNSPGHDDPIKFWQGVGMGLLFTAGMLSLVWLMMSFGGR